MMIGGYRNPPHGINGSSSCGKKLMLPDYRIRSSQTPLVEGGSRLFRMSCFLKVQDLSGHFISAPMLHIINPQACKLPRLAPHLSSEPLTSNSSIHPGSLLVRRVEMSKKINVFMFLLPQRGMNMTLQCKNRQNDQFFIFQLIRRL